MLIVSDWMDSRAADEYRQELDNQSAKPDKSSFLFKGQKNHGASAQPVYHNRQPIEQAPPNLIKMVPFYALWVVVILALVIYLFNRQESIDLAQQDPGILALKQSTARLPNTGEPNNIVPSAKINQDNTTTPNEANSRDVTSNSTSAPTSVQDNTVASGPNNNQVTLLAKKHVWVEVKATSSGEALFTGFMEAGVSHNFTDQEGLRIRAGNGGNVQITYAGKTEDLGAVGKIAEKTFTNNISKTASITSPVAENQDVASKRHTELTSADSAKKTAEKPAVTKKPLVAAGATIVHKQAIPGQTAQGPVHKYGQGEGISAGNKAIDVPYRYNE